MVELRGGVCANVGAVEVKEFDETVSGTGRAALTLVCVAWPELMILGKPSSCLHPGLCS